MLPSFSQAHRTKLIASCTQLDGMCAAGASFRQRLQPGQGHRLLWPGEASWKAPCSSSGRQHLTGTLQGTQGSGLKHEYGGEDNVPSGGIYTSHGSSQPGSGSTGGGPVSTPAISEDQPAYHPGHKQGALDHNYGAQRACCRAAPLRQALTAAPAQAWTAAT